ncbi:MAG: hypothetical protein ABSH33_12785 [Steroidobacteraceae bacterium]|jgi:hypothetical protein
MNTIRMAAFVAAVLITAFFARVLADALAVPQPIHAVTGTAVRLQSAPR